MYPNSSQTAGRRPRSLFAAAGLTCLVGLAWLLIDRGPAPAVGAPVLTADAPDLLLRSGGGTTTIHAGDRAFSLSARSMGLPDRIRFADGDVPFEHPFGPEDGLGASHNADSCLGCHVGNGRSPAADGFVADAGPVLLLALADGSPHPDLGQQLQDRGTAAEGTLTVDWVEEPGEYPDGTPFSLRRPVVSVDGADVSGLATSLRAAPPVFGGGLLEAIDVADLRALADPDDTDGDGVSGRLQEAAGNDGAPTVGRFGWKAQHASILATTRHAFDVDLHLDHDLATEAFGDDFLADTAFYTRTVAVPAIRDRDDPDVQAGAAWFTQIGCAACHRTEPYVTATVDVQALSDEVITPFTDLLLHDLGPGLADDLPQGVATGAEWRTPPLWGIGLTGVVGHEHYLHDGRARTLEEAILWHGGEAEGARSAFMALSAADRALVLRFLSAL
jgi:CxxC motif-containing protein (DUF1111 family)